MRKSLVVLLVLCFVLICVAGCDPNDGEFDPNAIVVMGKKSDMEKIYMRKIFARYKSVTGKNINIVKADDDVYEEEIQKRFSEGEDAPDILFHFNDNDLTRLNVAENFLYMDGENWADKLTDSAKNYCTSADGHLLGLPFWESSVSGCYYNKKIFEERGWNPARIQTNFDKLCALLVRDGITPICWPGDGCSWMYQFGLDHVFADEPNGPQLLQQLNSGEINYANIPSVRNMVEWLSGAAKKGWFGKDYMQIGWDDMSAKMSSGECAMIFIWDTWFYTDFTDGKYSKEDFALMPTFMNTVDGGTYEGGNLNMMMVNKNSEKLDLAKEFVSFCATADSYNYAFEGISTVSVFEGQTTNIQSVMVTEEKTAMSIARKERVSTASTKIVGYSAEDVDRAFDKLFKGEVDVDGCIELLDKYRLEKRN